MPRKKKKDFDLTLHAVICGVLFNGYIQGKSGKNLNSAVINEAIKEINKEITKPPKGGG